MSALKDDIVGHFTRADGTHEPMTRTQADALMAHVEEQRKARETLMPDAQAARQMMHAAYYRLEELGWKRGSYCPKDGSPFAAVEHGSTGVFTGFYSGDWPDGTAIIEDSCVHPHGFLWKPLDRLTGEEEAARQRSCEDSIAFSNQMGRMAQSMQGMNDG